MKKSMLFLFVLQMLVSCAEDRSNPLTFSLKEQTQSDFSTCEGQNCPEIKLAYLMAEGKDSVSQKINQGLNQRRIEILMVTQDQPLAESVEKAVENFISEYQYFLKEYPEFPARYEVQISDEIAHRSEKRVVIKTKYYVFTGGAHGYGATNFNTFSTETGKLLPPKTWFSDWEGFANYAEKKFREQYEIPENAPINSTGFFFENDTFSLPNNMAVLEDEVVLIYNQYEAAAYAEGELELRFPKAEVEEWLR